MTGDGRERGTRPPADAPSGERPPSGAERPDAGGAVGDYLARQRRLRGISLDELCERTRIPRRNLERLEAGAFDDQRDGFSRGFVRTVALALGLDADEAVMRLMREPTGSDEPEGAFDLRDWLPRLVALVALAAVALALWAALAVLRGSDAPDPEPAVVYRPDVVRRLAEEMAAAPPPAADVPSAVPALRPAAEPAAGASPSALAKPLDAGVELALPAPPAP